MTARRYVVRCDCCQAWDRPHYILGHDGTAYMWCAGQTAAKRYTLAQARRIVADGPGRVVRLVPRRGA